MLIAAGITCVVLGTIGAFVPLLPTTPFLILASYCFLKSSSKLHRWIMTNRFTGKYLSSYIEHGRIHPAVLWINLIVLWSSISLTVLLLKVAIWIKVVLVVIAVGVTIHLATLRKNK